jgi:hypothetical protein
MQVLISTRSKTKYYNPHSKEEHIPMVVGRDQDETGLVCTFTVKVNFTGPFLNLFISIIICRSTHLHKENNISRSFKFMMGSKSPNNISWT